MQLIPRCDIRCHSNHNFTVSNSHECRSISDCAELDIVFVVDESGSICDQDPTFNPRTQLCRNWVSVRNFLAEVVQALPVGVRGTHVGLITYRGEVVVDWLLDR